MKTLYFQVALARSGTLLLSRLPLGLQRFLHSRGSRRFLGCRGSWSRSLLWGWHGHTVDLSGLLNVPDRGPRFAKGFVGLRLARASRRIVSRRLGFGLARGRLGHPWSPKSISSTEVVCKPLAVK